jgi:eukaryotic-like serine/threonine-protein kinase
VPNGAAVSEAAVAVAQNDLVLGRYRPLQPLGSGGSGSVWLARDEPTGVEVALKIVPREGKAAARAEREASAAARLRHPGCQRAYALARDSRHVYIAYEYVPGKTLRQALREGAVDDAATLEVSAQICEALAHAHAHGIVHRDVKPANVLLAEDDEGISIRLLDFGLARMDGEETLTAAGDVPGTLAYIPPERLRGEESGAPADVWAVGVLLWEALAGWHPFWKGSLLDTARRIESGAVSLSRARPDLPRPLIALVDRALSPDPAKRPSAAKLAAALRATRHRRERRGRTLPQVAPPPAGRFAPAAAAGVFAGATSAALPFYPTGWPLGLAAVAVALTLVRERAGLALALAVPVLPLGNLSAGLAWAYGAAALAWLALAWRDARTGLLFVAGPLLAPPALLGLLPLAAQPVRSAFRRAAQVFAAVIVAAVVAGVSGSVLPFTGSAPPALDLNRTREPLAAAGALWQSLSLQPGLLAGAIVLAAAAAALPHIRRRWIAPFGLLLLGGIVLPNPVLPDVAIVATTLVTCLVLAVKSES